MTENQKKALEDGINTISYLIEKTKKEKDEDTYLIYCEKLKAMRFTLMCLGYDIERTSKWEEKKEVVYRIFRVVKIN